MKHIFMYFKTKKCLQEHKCYIVMRNIFSEIFSTWSEPFQNFIVGNYSVNNVEHTQG